MINFMFNKLSVYIIYNIYVYIIYICIYIEKLILTLGGGKNVKRVFVH